MTRSPRSWWTRTALCGVGVASLLSASLVPDRPAAAAPAARAFSNPECRVGYGTNFDADQLLDLAIGVPSEDRGSVAGAGAVEIRHPCTDAAPQFLALPRAHAHDGFGTALAAARLNDDDYTDLAVGVPGLDVRGRRNAGGVALFYGSVTGLHYATTLTQDSANMGGSIQAGARFGQTLAISGAVSDDGDKLRIGEPGRTVAGQKGAGGVVDYALYRGRYQERGSGEITMATKGVPGDPKAGDAMGASLYSFYKIGIPNRAVDGARGAGAVLYTSYEHNGRYSLQTQASPGVPSAPETGDHFGASLSGKWIGAPGESVGDVVGAGVVISPNSDPAQRFMLNQHDADPTQVVEANDHFGAAVTELGVLQSEEDWWPQQLLVGAPGQDVDGRVDAGTVSVVEESASPEGTPFTLGRRFGELQPAEPVARARFGAVVARLGLRTLQVGAPSARGGRLSVFVGAEGYDGPPALWATQAQQAGTPERGDRYGDAVVASGTVS